MTGQSLFYMGETNLKHKILAIAEEEGARRAGYALKLLQSEGELTIASHRQRPGDGQSGDAGIPRGGPGDAVPHHHRDRYRRGAVEPLPGADGRRKPRADPRDPRPAAPRGKRSKACWPRRSAQQSWRCTATPSGCSSRSRW